MKLLRIAGRVVAGLILLIVVALGVVYVATEAQLGRRITMTSTDTLVVRNDSATLAQGRHLADAVLGCVHCHGADLGGDVLVDEPLVMRLAAPNLTTGDGGVLANYSDADLELAIRHGVAPGGRLLRFMPSHEYAGVADDQLAAVIAYMRAQPPVNRNVLPMKVGPVARVLTLTGQLALIPYDRIDHKRRAPAVAPVGATIEHGRYLAAGCVGCHGDGLSGGKIPGAPPDWPAAANITPTGIGTWSEADFVRAIRSGTRPDGTPINPVMPWKQMAGMTDDELLALRRYLATVPARATGNR